MSGGMVRSAAFSPCRSYRYSLTREWDAGLRRVVFVGLNPSTADETADDPTIRRCIGFAKAWGCGGIVMLNLFAFRATDPSDMKRAGDPVGPDNDTTLRAHAADFVVAAWGAHGTYRNRDAEVRDMLPALYALGLTKDGQPRHPLYLRGDCQPFLFHRREAA